MSTIQIHVMWESASFAFTASGPFSILCQASSWRRVVKTGIEAPIELLQSPIGYYGRQQTNYLQRL